MIVILHKWIYLICLKTGGVYDKTKGGYCKYIVFICPRFGTDLSKKNERGATILIDVIIVGNLNAIWLSAYAVSSSVPATFFGNTPPRLLHDIFSIYGIIFWI
ncbi:MAG: hypothetical protein JSV67_02385 [Thermoplasmatales archaeon]|nr:MAG: hypothetical protein JSV67_02385 [Thermoplasmatales archaeon]